VRVAPWHAPGRVRFARPADNPGMTAAPAAPAGAPEGSSPPAPTPSPTGLWLGYAGLLPFLGGALLVWLVRPEERPFAAQALSAYAALIVSFLGGIHWGLAFARPAPAPTRFVWGVVPSLLAWVAVMMPASSGLVLSGALLLLTWAVDRRTYPQLGAAQWLTLRFRLSAAAALSCFVGAAGI
jgi:Protein of unknown function (DUF3429)